MGVDDSDLWEPPPLFFPRHHHIKLLSINPTFDVGSRMMKGVPSCASTRISSSTLIRAFAMDSSEKRAMTPTLGPRLHQKILHNTICTSTGGS
ncbi:VIR_N domain-containing protein [Psidium guajava]|nr:VIR_N domain-containing protein [Psidium guajava]